MKKPELLAPAGAWESMAAAVQNGADAVYFGTGGFNARANAANFVGDEARKAIDYCHERGVKAYLTLNTLILDREVDAAVETAGRLYEYGADSFIVQDIGLITLLRKQLKGIELHGSTQMAIHNTPGVERARELGLRRVVLARETSLEEIRHICQAVPGIGIEAFVHGAMCVSVSGQCLLSSFIGERSGNRGACAQPCRLPYRMNGQNGYLLSMKDLCMLECVGQLRDAGVMSFKIEGRMKRPEYVAIVTRAYRKAIDGEIADMQGELADLKKIFDRGPFSTGYYYGRDGQVDTAQSGNVGAEADRDQLRQAQESYRGEKRTRPVSAVFCAQEGEAAMLTLSLGVHSATAMGEVVLPAVKAPLDNQAVQASIGKFGGTPFSLGSLQIELRGKTPAGVFLPVRALNELRRSAAEALQQAIAQSFRRTPVIWEKTALGVADASGAGRNELPLLVARVATMEQAEAAVRAGADALQVGLRQWNRQSVARWSAFAQAAPKPVEIALPPVLMDEELKEAVELLRGTAFSGAVVGNIGQIAPLQSLFPVVRGDFTLNITNGFSALAHKEMGLASISPSVELNLRQICDIINRIDSDVVLYGFLPMMQLAHCPIRRSGKGCAPDCAQGRILEDRKGANFRLLPVTVRANRCTVQLLNSVPLDGLKFYSELSRARARAWLLLFTGETGEETFERVSAYKSALSGGEAVPLPGSTGGHLARGVQ